MLMKLGLLAGGGHLPRLIQSHCLHSAIPLFILGFEGQPLGVTSHALVPLGAVQKSIDHLRQAGVTALVFAGTLSRPSWGDLKPDKLAAQWLFKMGKKAFGDNGLLSGILSELQKEGFQILSVQDLLPELMTPQGALGRVQPSEEDLIDIQRGIDVAKALGSVDVGQAVVVEKGVVLGVEAIEGTAALLARIQPLRREKRGGVLVKVFKPSQDSRIDLPTIGQDTIAQAAGLHGIALESSASLILDRAQTLRDADQNGLFIYGFKK